MIFINSKDKNIIDAKNYHKEELSKLLKVRIENLNLTKHQRIFLRVEILPVLTRLLIGRPNTIKKISDKLILTPQKESAVKLIFNYTEWFSVKKSKMYNAYKLASNLDINTCVYCNRNYTSTVEKITRPGFDHYFSQTKYPLLALSFFNLIPSCSICNSYIKGKKELILKDHLHPYINDCLVDFRFSYAYDIQMKDSLISKIKYLKKKSKVKSTFDFFKIDEIYNAHTDELRDLIKTRDTFSDRYLEILSKTILAGTLISRGELYQLAFGVYIDEKNVSKRPFSKFKKDILTELGVI